MITEHMTMHRANALLFDMDGTLVDSRLSVERTWRYFAKRYDLNIDDILSQSHGRSTAETVALFATAGMDIEKETAHLVAREIADTRGIKAIAGAKNLLLALPAKQWAIVTSASYQLALCRLTAARLPIPKVLICAEHVQYGKPAPQGYLTAASALQVSPEECLVFEDSAVGLAAAYAAGIRVVSVGKSLQETKTPRIGSIANFTSLVLDVGKFSHPMPLTLTISTS